MLPVKGSKLHLLVLEDDPIWRAALENALQYEGYNCTTCSNVAAAKSVLRRDSFDLLLLDWNLPDATGYDLLLWIRERLEPRPPVIMVTSRSGAEDIVQALNAGADDFVVKPCEADVLKARVGAVIRRVSPPPGVRPEVEELSGAIFHRDTRIVDIAGQSIELTDREFILALILFQNIGRPLGRGYLLERVWGAKPDLQTRTLDVHISKIRSRLGLRAESGFRLLPVYNFGYRLEKMLPETALENV
jgi:DNA-binding response OmpR family regulator